MLNLPTVPVENKMGFSCQFSVPYFPCPCSVFILLQSFISVPCFPCFLPLSAVVSLSFPSISSELLSLPAGVGGACHWNCIQRLIILPWSCTVIAVSGPQAQQAATVSTPTQEQICCMLMINFWAKWGQEFKLGCDCLLRNAPSPHFKDSFTNHTLQCSFAVVKALQLSIYY